MRAIGLIRISTEEQAGADRAGIDRQREAIRLAAQRHGLKIVRWVIVKESGKYILADSQFQQIFPISLQA
jgi:DNA invertase Pin-like site-specific DNA recombinase